MRRGGNELQGKQDGPRKLHCEDAICEVAIEMSRGRTFQAEVTAGTMALKWERAVSVLGRGRAARAQG